MPFNRDSGELIGDLGHAYRVVPTSNWLDSNLFDVAAESAAQAFHAAGALLPVDISSDDCLVQEYPATNTVAFLFQRRIGGVERFYPYVFKLPPALVEELVTAGRWQREITKQ